MDNINLILGILQWGLFFFFVIINLLIGYKRGTKKTLYYTLVSVSLTVLIFFGISFLSVRMLFNSVGRFIYFVEAYATIPDNIRNILVNPDLSPFVFAVIDIVFKFIVFIVLYTPLKALLTRIIFKPIYDKVFARRKKPIYLPSRFGGAVIGAFRGVFVTIMLLLPIIVISGAFNKYDSSNETNLIHDKTLIDSNSSGLNDDEMDDLEELLIVIQSFNKEGIGSLSSKLKFKNGKKSFDEFMFDLIYSSTIKDKKGNKETIYLSEELSSYGKIVQILIEEGYLKEDFDFKTINYDDNYEHINLMLESLGESKLIDIMIPFAVDIANDEGIFEKELGFNPKLNPYTKNAYESIYNLKFKDETKAINNVVKELLLIGNVSELIDIANDPELILELTQDEKQRLGNILKEISNLEILKVSNILIEMVLRDEKLLEEITWVSNPDKYLHEHLEFVFNDISLIQNEILNIGNILLNVFKDEYEDFDYSSFVDGKNVNFETLLKEEASKIVSEVILGVANSKLTTQNIPILVDYLVYTSNDNFINELSDKLSEASRDQNYKDEITNVDNIYGLLVTLGLENLLDNDQNKIVAVDNILKEDGNFDVVKQIINNIFEESKAVNDVLEIVTEPLIYENIKDEDLRDLLLYVINEDDFKLGTEVVNLINILESVYKFTDMDTVVTAVNDKEYIELLKDLGNSDKDFFDGLVNNILNLQTLNTGYKELLNYGFSKVNNLHIEINENYNYDDFKTDLELALGIAYEGAKTLNTLGASQSNYKDINLAEGIDYTSLNNLFDFTLEKHGNSIILTEAMNQIRKQNFSIGKFGNFEIPDEYKTVTLNEEWIEEFNLLSTGLVDILKAFSSEDETFKLSINNITNIKSLNDVPTNRVVLFEDEDYAKETFTNLLSSNILKHNLENLITKLLIDNKLPISVFNDNVKDVLNGENYAKTISTLATLLDEFTETNNENLNQTIKNVDAKNAIRVLNTLNDDKLNKLGYNEIISTVIRETILNTDIHNNLYDQINKLKLPNELKDINSGIFEFNYSKDEDGNLNNDTFYELLYFARSLQVPNYILGLSNSEKVNTLINRLNEDTVDNLFNVKVLHEVLSNVMLLDEVKLLGNNQYNKLMTILNNRKLEISLDYDKYYNTILSTLMTEKLIDKNEMKLYLNSLQTLYNTGVRINDIRSLDLNKIGEHLSIANNENKTAIDYLSDTKLLRKTSETILKDDEFITSLVKLINSNAKINNKQIITVTNNNFKLGENYFDEDGLKKENINQILLAVSKQDLNSLKSGKVTIRNIEGLLDGDDKTRLSYIYDVDIFRNILNKVITSKQTSEQLLKAINKGFELATTKLNTNNHKMTKEELRLTYELVDYDSAKQLIEFVTSSNIRTINDLIQVRTLDDLGAVLDLTNTREPLDNLTSLNGLFHLYESVITSDAFKNIAKDALYTKSKGLVNINKERLVLPERFMTSHELSNLIIALYGSSIDFNSLNVESILDGLTESRIVDGNNKLGIDHALDSDLLYYVIDKGLNAKEDERVNSQYIKLLNNQLKKQNANNEITKEDEIFIYHDSVYDGKVISKEAIVELVFSAKALNYEGAINLNTFINTLDRNIIDGEDDFDRMYNSLIIQSIVSNMMLNDTIIDIAAIKGNSIQRYINLTQELLEIPADVIEDNLVDKDQVKSLFRSISLIGTSPNVENILSLEDGGDDDLDTFLESFIIHTYIDRIVKSQEADNIVTKLANKIANKKVVGLSGKPEDNQLDSNGMFSKEEIRKLFVSAKLLDMDNLGLNSITSLNNTDDDLNVFLDSNYLRVVLSRILVHEDIKELILKDEEITLEYAEKDEYGNLSKDEVYKLFVGLDVLDLDGLGGIDNNKLKSLSDDDLDKVLESFYLYEVIDITLKKELKDDVGEDSLNALGYIKKSEIKSLIELLEILDINNPEDVNSNNITVEQLDEAVKLESTLINKLLSNEIIKTIDVPSESINEYDTIKSNELNNLLEALELLIGKQGKIGTLNMEDTDLSTTLLGDLIDIQNGESRIVRRLISEGVIKTINEAVLLNTLENNDKDLIKEELTKLHQSLVDLGIEELTGEINTNDININTLIGVTDNNESSIITIRLISNAIDEALKDDTENAVRENGFIVRDETNNLFKSINELGIDNLDTLDEHEFDKTSLESLNDVIEEDSTIVKRLISKAIIEKDDILVVSEDVKDSDKDIIDEELKNFIYTASQIEDVDTIQELINLIREIEDETNNENKLILVTKITNAYDEDRESIILKDTVSKLID